MIVVANFHNPNKPSHFPDDSYSFPRPSCLMGLMLLYIVDIVEIVCAMLWLLLTVRKVCVTLYIASPMVLWWGSLGRVAGQVSGGQTAWLLFTTPTSSTSITVCAVCLLCVCCVCVCVCVYVEITVLTKATVSGSVGPVYRRDFLAPRSARCSEPYVPSKLLLRLFWAVGSRGGVGGVGEGGEGVGGQQQ